MPGPSLIDCRNREVGEIRIMFIIYKTFGGARGVMVIVVENGHGDTSSNPGRGWLHFT